MSADILKFISKIYRKSQMYLNEQVKPMELTSGQIPFIVITCRNGKMVQNKFCELLDMDKSTVAKMLAKLETQGYVLRKMNQIDCRFIDVYPTQKALEIYPVLTQIGEKWSLQLTSHMTETEKALFFDVLQNAAKNINFPFT